MKKQPKFAAYEELALVPVIIADTVIDQSSHVLDAQQREEFALLCDARCRQAYEARAKWMLACVNADRPDHLYRWIRHWLDGYVANPECLRRVFEPTNPM